MGGIPTRSNFLGTKFTVYDSQPPSVAAILSNSRSSRRLHSRQVSPRVPAGNYHVATICYELNVLRTRGPRRMLCTLHSIPNSAVQEGGVAPTPTGFLHSLEEQFSASSAPKQSDPLGQSSLTSHTEVSRPIQSLGEPLILKNKAPRWHEQLQCWCLNFRGRVTVASVKNFQLVAAGDPLHQGSSPEQYPVILQFGKIGKDIFTMDYRFPLSAFQAFAICLSSFDTKPACEWITNANIVPLYSSHICVMSKADGVNIFSLKNSSVTSPTLELVPRATSSNGRFVFYMCLYFYPFLSYIFVKRKKARR